MRAIIAGDAASRRILPAADHHASRRRTADRRLHRRSEYSAYEAQLLVTSANLAAVFLERQRLQAAAGKAEALQEADRLKTTLVSSISHELKTPLAAITATVTEFTRRAMSSGRWRK